MKSKHQDFNVRPCGLVVDPKFPFAGASPDGLVSCSCCEAIVLEIKCTFKYRNHSPIADEPLADSTFFLKKDAAGLVHLSTRHKHLWVITLSDTLPPQAFEMNEIDPVGVIAIRTFTVLCFL